jgi:drug/metabolite transporter (DMT)-like permease
LRGLKPGRLLDKNPALKGILLACTTAVFWGILAIALKFTVKYIHPYSIVWIRYLFAFLSISIWFLITDKKKLGIIFRPPLLLLTGAIFLGINYIGYMQGIRYSGPENAQILIQLGPIMLAAAGIIFFKERLSFRQFMGFIIAGIGLYIFFNDQSGHSLVDKSEYKLSVFYLVIAAVSWSIYGISQKKLVRTWPSQQLNLVIFGLPVLLFLPFVNFSDFTGLSMKMWLILLFLGVNTIIPYAAFAACLKYIEANKASIIIILNPIITFLVMALLTWLDVTWITHENITLYGFAGVAFVLSGAVLAILPKRSKQ